MESTTQSISNSTEEVKRAEELIQQGFDSWCDVGIEKEDLLRSCSVRVVERGRDDLRRTRDGGRQVSSS